MTHADLLLLASCPRALRHGITPDEARSLVSAFDSLLEERDALSAQAQEAERKLGTAMRAGVAMSEAHEAAVDRASSAESELVRMSERTEAMRGRVEALAETWDADMVRLRERASRQYLRGTVDEAIYLTAANNVEACLRALRSLVNESAPTNDKEKTR